MYLVLLIFYDLNFYDFFKKRIAICFFLCYNDSVVNGPLLSNIHER